MRKKLNFAIVGVGYWGPNYARILSELSNAQLVWTCDTDELALRKMKSRYPSISVTTNWKVVVKDPVINCIIVVTPAKFHYEIVKSAIKMGKDVLVEKPLTIDLNQAESLIKWTNSKKSIVTVDHTFKFNPAILKLKHLLDRGELGRVYYIYGLYNALGPIRKDVSAMWDISPHFIYTANFLLGKLPLYVSANGASFLRPSMEDVVFLNLEYPGGVLVSLHSSWLDPVKVRQLVVVGSKKMAVFDDLSHEGKLKIYDKSATIGRDPNFANLQVILRYGKVVIPKIEEREPLKDLLLNFVSSVNRRSTPFVTLQEGRDVVKILSALQQSLSLNNIKIKI